MMPSHLQRFANLSAGDLVVVRSKFTRSVVKVEKVTKTAVTVCVQLPFTKRMRMERYTTSEGAAFHIEGKKVHRWLENALPTDTEVVYNVEI